MSCFLCGSQEAEMLPRMGFEQVRCPTCGLYTLTEILLATKLIRDEQKYLLSALTRQASDAGRPLTLTTENISLLLESVPDIGAPLENLNRTLLFVKTKQHRADEFVQPNPHIDYPLVSAHDADEFIYFLNTLKLQSFLEASSHGILGGVRLTPRGWQRVLELKKTERDSDQAFVAMSFAKELKEAWENGFKPALEATGFHAYRVDRDEHNDKIDDRIIAEIRRSGLLVADFTGHRGGVYFEAGFAMGLGIPVIWTCKEDDIRNAHFDTRQYNHIGWTDPTEIKSKLILRIIASIPGRKTKTPINQE